MTSREQSNNLEPPADNAAGFRQNEILGGRYRVISLLGQGGMGVVYKVEQIFLGKEMALKTIEKSEQSDFTLRRFQTEARAVFKVNHPNIIDVHDFGLLDDGTPFMAMEVVVGKTLGEILESRVLSSDEAISLFIQVCFGLAHAHESGVIHRDIKPNNIMVIDGLPWGTEGSVKVLDFGIAKLTQHDGGEIQALTRTGEIFGSPFYMSPEQCLGGKIDHRSDVYSLGCVIYESLTGAPPFAGDSALNTMMMHHSAPIPSVRASAHGKNCPEELDAIIQRMLAKNPDERYQHLGHAAHDLAALKRGDIATTFNTVSSPVITVQRPVKPSAAVTPNMVKMGKLEFFLLLSLIAGIWSIISAATTVAVSWKLYNNSPKRVIADPLPKSELLTVPSEEVDNANLKNDFQEPRTQRRVIFKASGYPTDETLKILDGYPDVQGLELRDCAVTDSGLRFVNHSNLIWLDLAGDKRVTVVNNIVKQKTLNSLDLSGTNINDLALSKLATLPNLESLTINNCPWVTEKGLQALSASNSLLRLHFEEKFPEGAIEQLQNKMKLCSFNDRLSKFEQWHQKNTNLPQEEFFRQAQEIVTKNSPRHNLLASILYSRAGLRTSSAQAAERESLMQQATSLCEQNGEEKVFPIALFTQAYEESKLGHRARSADLVQRAMKHYLRTRMLNDKCVPGQLQQALAAPGYDDNELRLKIAKLGLEITKRFPDEHAGYEPIFLEDIGWTYYREGKRSQALPYLRELLEYCRQHKNDPPATLTMATGQTFTNEKPLNLLARALIECGHCEPKNEERKRLYNEGFDLMDELNLPKEVNLREHYIDACSQYSDLLDAEGKPAEALKVLNRAAVVLSRMDRDAEGRRNLIQSRITAHQRHIHGAK